MRVFKSKSEQRRVEAMSSTAAKRSYKAKIKIYRDASHEFRWRLVASNGRIIADSAEGYTDKYHCQQAVERFIEAVLSATIVETAEVL